MARTTRWGTVALGLLVAAAGAQQSPTSEPRERAAIAQPAPADGLKVYVDPASGEMMERPTAEQLARFRDAVSDPLRQDSADLAPFFLSGVGRGVFLQGRFQSALRARVLEDGRFSFSCVDADRGDAGEREPAAAPSAAAAAEVR